MHLPLAWKVSRGQASLPEGVLAVVLVVVVVVVVVVMVYVSSFPAISG